MKKEEGRRATALEILVVWDAGIASARVVSELLSLPDDPIHEHLVAARLLAQLFGELANVVAQQHEVVKTTVGFRRPSAP